jgi:hypothetical protein
MIHFSVSNVPNTSNDKMKDITKAILNFLKGGLSEAIKR